MLIRIFSPTECGLIRDADLKKCGLNRMTTVIMLYFECHVLTNTIHKATPKDEGSSLPLRPAFEKKSLFKLGTNEFFFFLNFFAFFI
jgi:hypothetical protein